MSAGAIRVHRSSRPRCRDVYSSQANVFDRARLAPGGPLVRSTSGPRKPDSVAPAITRLSFCTQIEKARACEALAHRGINYRGTFAVVKQDSDGRGVDASSTCQAGDYAPRSGMPADDGRAGDHRCSAARVTVDGVAAPAPDDYWIDAAAASVAFCCDRRDIALGRRVVDRKAHPVGGACGLRWRERRILPWNQRPASARHSQSPGHDAWPG